MKLIAGLGNPGRIYQNNRHNIGFMCITHLAKAHRIGMDEKRNNARIGKGTIAGEEVVLARPQTGMNISGQSIAPLAHRFKIVPNDLIVIHDDLDLPFGKIRIRLGSSSGGHKGVESIIRELGSRDFYRIRVGIGRPLGEDENTDKFNGVIDHVLGDFTDEEKPAVNEVITRVGDAVVCLITGGLTAAMNKYN
ncbi:MAG: aminoacyl-tRNA hydrolase [Dehalococcoidales bacterium]|nr:aminoacyl-tRNA hydrolase [Dehalococcoidales bacterium]